MAKREELIHYIDTSMGQEEASYALIGDGVSSMTEEFNVEEETTQWINQTNGNTEVRSYTPSIEVEKQSDGFPPQKHRLHFPELQSDPGADRGAEHHFSRSAGLQKAGSEGREGRTFKYLKSY